MNVMNKKKGFTLVELMIGIVLAMLVLSIGYVYFSGSQRASERSTLQAEMLDNVRISMDVVARFFRRSGFNVNFKDYTNNVLVIGSSNYGTTIVHGNSTSGPDSLELVASNPRQISEVAVDAFRGETKIVVKATAAIAVGEVVSFGYASSNEVIAPAPVASGADMTVTLKTPLRADLPAGQPVFEVHNVSTLNIDSSSGTPILELDGEPLAENIEDFQVAFGVDVDQNGVIDPAEWKHVLTATDATLIRLARVTIVGRTSREIRGAPKQGSPINIEDHTVPVAAPADAYSRYMLTRTIMIRNIFSE